MPQGKLKVKTNVPKSVKKKATGGRSSARKSKPAIVKPKLTKVKKINKQISKNVNAALEEEIRQIANDGQRVALSKKKTVAGSKKTKK